MDKDIFWFTRHGKYGFLSNFWRSPIAVNGRIYPTVEHYYQASKALLTEEHEMVRSTKTPKEAKFAGYHVTLKPNWEAIKVDIMLDGIRAKFIQWPSLKKQLLATGTAILHEDSPWDKYWGYAKGSGLDKLGELIMQVREELRQHRTN